MKVPRYSRKEAEKVARRFFTYDYHDRGMLKWQGYFLSDHTSALNRQKKQRPEQLQPQLSEEVLGRRLKMAWQKQLLVHLQLNILDGNHLAVGLDGLVAGCDDALVILQDRKQRYHQIPINQLRWVGKLVK